MSLPSLIGYLRKSHSHFIDYSLPLIKKMLIEGIHQTTTSEISIHIMNFFDNYVAEVRKHMEYENDVIFTYVENLLEGKVESKFKISDFSAHHEHVAASLTIWRSCSCTNTTSRTTNSSTTHSSIS